VTSVPAPGPHAAAVDADNELFVVENLREARLALDLLRLFLPIGAESHPIPAGLRELHERLCAEEDRQLQSDGVPDRYLIVRPISPFNPPPPQDMERIADAVRTLASLGMIAGRGDACLPALAPHFSKDVTIPGSTYTLS
jgi:hypothetical protein